MNSRDFRLLFLYEWKGKHNTAGAPRRINAAFRNGSVNDRTFRRRYAKFGTRDKSITNETRGQTTHSCGHRSFVKNT